MGLINLTPHTLNLHSGGYYGSEVFVLQPVGPAPRLVEETAPAGVAYPHRRDLYYPYPLVRDDSGRIIGASGLGQVPASL